MYFNQLLNEENGCSSYIIADRDTHECAVIDPALDIEPYLEIARDRELQFRFIIDTHLHADHISGGPALAEELGVPYWLHPYDGIHPLDVLPARLSYRCLGDGMELPVGRQTVRVLWIPGHTLGNSALLVGRWLFSGDSIFVRSIARPDLGGRAEAWTRCCTLRTSPGDG